MKYLDNLIRHTFSAIDSIWSHYYNIKRVPTLRHETSRPIFFNVAMMNNHPFCNLAMILLILSYRCISIRSALPSTLSRIISRSFCFDIDLFLCVVFLLYFGVKVEVE